MWYDLFKKLSKINEGFKKGKEMIHEDMPEDVRQFVRGALYHLDPAKVLRVAHLEEDQGDVWEVNIHTYQKIALVSAKEYFDNIMEEQVGMHGFDPDRDGKDLDPEWPAYRHIIGDQDIGLEIFISYEHPEDVDNEPEDDEPEEESPRGHGHDREDDPADWWKR